MRKRLGLRSEVALHLGVLLTAALLFFGLVQLKLSERQQSRAHLDHLSSQLRVLQSSLSQMATGQPATLLYRQAEKLLRAGHVAPRSYAIIDTAGQRVLPVSGRQMASLDKGAIQQARLSRELQLTLGQPAGFWGLEPGGFREARFVVPLMSQYGYAGALQVSYHLADFWSDRWSSVNLMLLYVAGFSLCLLVFGVSLLDKTVIRPIRKLSQATQAITLHRFETPLPPEGPREIVELTDAFNRMTVSLQEEQQKTAATIRHLQDANRSLAETREELIRSEKLASVGHLAAGMAHEIGNPLGATLGYLNFLKQEVDEDQQQDILQRSITELQRIDLLVRDLLDYATPTGSPAEYRSVRTLVENAITLLQHQGALQKMSILLEVEENCPPICIRTERMTQVVVNLLLNARDAMNGGGEVQIQGFVADSIVHVQFRDNGPGMDATTARNVFEPFFTTKGPGEGRGLGLAVCQRVIEEAGGKIVLTSTPGQGSCFDLQFPKATEDACHREN